MNRDETKLILAFIYTAYPPSLLPPVATNQTDVWHELLGDLPFAKVKASVVAWATTNKYPPTIADIRRLVVTRPDEPTGEQAWTKVSYAIRHFGYTEPKEAKEYLGDIWNYMGEEWSYFCRMMEKDEPYEKARFIKSYDARQQSEQRRLQIPEKIRKMLVGVTEDRLELGDGSDDGLERQDT